MKSDSFKDAPPMHILMPVYNAEKFLEKSIASALKQTYSNVKLLVFDDASTDASMERIKKFSDNRIKILENSEKNRGVAYARRILVKESKKLENAYILWLDADDQYTDSTFISSVIKQMQKTKAEICLFNFSIAYENDDENLKKNAIGLIKEQEEMTKILDFIASLDTFFDPISDADKINILKFTSLGWTKAYAPNVKIPEPTTGDVPFADFLDMALLLKYSITALPSQKKPIEYLRRSTSICGQRKPENFTHHVPARLEEFFNLVSENSKNHPNRLKQLNLAQDFVVRKFAQYEGTLTNLLATRTDFPKSTLDDYQGKMQQIKTYIDNTIL